MAEGVGRPLPCHIRLIRLSPRRLDSDNLVMAFKAIRDCIAAILIPGKAAGRADDSPLISWSYGQESGPLAIRIEIYEDML